MSGKPSTQPFPVVAVMGPTASGKTSFAIRLAEILGGEIIGVDSVQIYKWLDIGSAKPTPEERERVPHHLVDQLHPAEPFDAATFATRASRLITAIRRRGKVPILAGGTGLYFRALFSPLAPAPPGLPAVRTMLREMAASRGPEALHRILVETDPEVAQGIHPHDAVRTTRALEVFYSTGRTMSQWRREWSETPVPWPVIKIGLLLPREQLYERIDRRVETMVLQGLEDEVRGLLSRGLSPLLKPLQSLGYRHMILYLKGQVTRAQALSLLKRDTRRYAKRQMTWFRSETGVRWVHPARREEKFLWRIMERTTAEAGSTYPTS